MKVICINNNGVEPFISEGIIYNVLKMIDEFYVLKEIEINPSTGAIAGFYQIRFIPLSSIDETEFERNYNKELI